MKIIVSPVNREPLKVVTWRADFVVVAQSKIFLNFTQIKTAIIELGPPIAVPTLTCARCVNALYCCEASAVPPRHIYSLGWAEFSEMVRSVMTMNQVAKRIVRRLRTVAGLPPPLAAVKADANQQSHYLLSTLKDRSRSKLAAIAGILKSSEAEAATLLFERMLAAMPNHAHASYLLPHLSIKRCERISEELVQIEMDNGRIFTGQRSNKKEYLLHQLFSRRIPEAVIGDAYKLALDIERRYFGTHLPWYCVKGGVYIEGGCYTGIRAIRWYDSIRKPKRILAVEIGKSNYEILKSNVLSNGLENEIVPVHAGLWSDSGQGVQKHSFSTRRFLQSTDRWEDQMQYEEQVGLLTIDDLMDQHSVDVADFVNIQVNGAEIEVLKGIKKTIDRIKVISIAAYYSQGDVRNEDVVNEMLIGLGCTILEGDAPGRITAVTSKYRDEILALRVK